jgi:hypothetical protein
MNLQLPTEKLNAGHLEMVWLRRRCYAFAITASAVFIMLLLSWSINVRAFRVDNDMKFRIPSSDTESIESLKSSLQIAMEDSTSDTYLIQQIARLRDAALLDSPYLSQSDLDSIRSRIKVFTKIEPTTQQAAVRISFTGRGSKGEREFVQRICEDLVAELRPKNDFSQVDLALEDVSKHLQNHVATQSRFSKSLRSMIDDVQVKLATIDARLQNAWQNNSEPVAETLAEARLQARESQLEKLKTAKDELLLDFEADPVALERIDQQIEVVQFEINQIQESPSPFGFKPNPRFHNVSYFREAEGNDSTSVELRLMSEISKEVNGIELDGMVSSVEMIDSHRRDDLSVPIEFLGKIKGNLSSATRVTSTASLLEPGRVSVKPMGGIPPAGQLVFLSFLALIFGTIVAWQVNPRDADRGFTDSNEIQKTLGVPVVSQFQLQSAIEKSDQGSFLFRLIRVCEILVLTVLVVVLLACVFSPTVRATMLENPLEGLTRIVWLFRKS